MLSAIVLETSDSDSIKDQVLLSRNREFHLVFSLMAMATSIYVTMLTTTLRAQEVVTLDCDELNESSGVAVSLNNPEFVWSHNDSGGKPRLYRFNRKSGKLSGTFEVENVPNVDWEDLCSFRVGEQNYLAIADTGDNARRRKSVEICIVKEPVVDSGDVQSKNEAERIDFLLTLEFSYPSGPADCEAIAFDPAHSRFILLTKEPISSRLFSVPIEPELLAARNSNRKSVAAKYLQGFGLSLITGADICPETRQLIVCNYGIGFLAQPSAENSLQWDASSLKKVKLPKRRQGESIAFASPTEVLLTSESAPSPLLTTTIEVGK
jgi:hypothetical protein